jgi:hypothetical protein
MFAHLIHLLHRALTALPSLVSTNWLGVLMSFAIFLLAQLLFLCFQGWASMKRQWKDSVAIGTVAVFVGWMVLYILSIVLIVYDDHQSQVQQNHALQTKLVPLQQVISGLVDPHDRDAEIAELKKSLKSYESSAIHTYPVSHDQRPGMPKMEYVMTTGKLRAPVDLTAKCDFPISDEDAPGLVET